MTWLFIVYAVAFVLALAACIVWGFVAGSIAKKKGYSFPLFWLFGFGCGVVALIVSLVIPNKNNVEAHTASESSENS